MLSLFKNLNKSESAGPDGIYSQLIIDCADLIAPHIISTTFNSSLANGKFPEDWKCARFTPLFK